MAELYNGGVLLECRYCGAPLAMKRKSRRATCRYCGRVEERERLRKLADEVPKDFVPPKKWTPPAHVEAEKKELEYKPSKADSPLFGIGVGVVITAGAVGIPLLAESNVWNTRPEVVAHGSPIGEHAAVAKQLHGKLTSPTAVTVALRSDLYDSVRIRWAKADDPVPSHVSLEVRHGKKADTGARDFLSKALNGGLDGGNWRWDDVTVSWSTGGISAGVGAGSAPQLRERRARAAWSLVMAAAFDPSLAPPAEEMRDVMGGGYPLATLRKIPPTTPLERVKATIAEVAPGAALRADTQMIATVPLDHPLFHAATIHWFVMVGGTVDDLSLDGRKALGHAVDAVARCMTPDLGAPRERVISPIQGKKSYTFVVDEVRIDLDEHGLTAHAYGAHGRPTTPDAATWDKLVAAVDRCRG